MENSIKMDDLGGTTIYGNTHMGLFNVSSQHYGIVFMDVQ
jgi:hypothetical protein